MSTDDLTYYKQAHWEMTQEAARQRDRADHLAAGVRVTRDALKRWVGRGHEPECESGSGPCERCAKASGASGLLRLLPVDEGQP